MQDARAVLASLLTRLDRSDADPSTRIEAASLANRLALFHGDPSLADVAESVATEPVPDLPDDVVVSLQAEGAIARATRRAIALSHRQRIHAPKDLALSMVADADVLAAEVKRFLGDGKKPLAQATLEVALTRHPDHPSLMALRRILPAQDPGMPAEG